MEALARDAATLAPAALMWLSFALGKAYDDLGRFGDALRCMNAGNALKRQRINYDEASMSDQFGRIRAAYDRKLPGKKPRGLSSDMPVFVLGMPRSGTTLIEQILASHPAVHGAGELTDFSRLANQMLDAKGRARRYPDDAAKLTAKELRDLGEAYVARLGQLAPDAPRVTDRCRPTSSMSA